MGQTTPKTFVFAMMPFATSFQDTYVLGIKPACEEANAYCERLDEQIFEERMLDRVYNQISKADVIVADMTGRNPNVFYEVGYAHALGKRVILVTKDASDIPFDLKHHFHIVYGESIAGLKQELRKRIEWYAANPKDERVEAAESLQFFIDGKAISRESEHGASLQDAPDGVSLRLEIGAFNSADVRVQQATVSLCLVTPPIFSRSVVYDPYIPYLFSIRLPSGDYLHQPQDPVTIQPGGWQKITFLLTTSEAPAEIANMTGAHRMKLQVLAGGPPRETEFILVVDAPTG
jgi:hypothetical protein